MQFNSAQVNEGSNPSPSTNSPLKLAQDLLKGCPKDYYSFKEWLKTNRKRNFEYCNECKATAHAFKTAWENELEFLNKFGVTSFAHNSCIDDMEERIIILRKAIKLLEEIE